MPDINPESPSTNRSHGLATTVRWERPVAPTEATDVTVLVQVQAGQDDTRRPSPVDVAFVLDRSGSMGGAKLTLAKRAVDVACGHLGDDDRAALVAYDQAVSITLPLAPATSRRKAALRLALHGIDPGGSTNLAGGWLTGCRELADAPPLAPNNGGSGRLRRTVLLTDGLANVGITDPAALIDHALALRERGVTTTALGVGLDFDEALLASLAEAGGGNFQFAAAAADLPAFFARELQDLLRVVAAGLSVQITVPDGVGITVVGPFPVEHRADGLRVALGDLPAGDGRDLVLRLALPPAAEGAATPINVALTWSDPAADAKRTITVTSPPLRRVAAEEAAAAPPDPLVTERSAVQRATVERREALALDRAGRHRESRDRMHVAARLLEAAPQTETVLADLRLSQDYAQAAPVPYGELERKRGAWHNSLRARGRREDRDPTPE